MVSTSPMLFFYQDKQNSTSKNNYFHNSINYNPPTVKSHSMSYKHSYSNSEKNVAKMNLKSSNRNIIGFGMTYSQSNDGICNLDMGSYLDVCGECTGNQAMHKVDECGVCEGDSRCISCDPALPESRLDACGNCGLPFDDNWNNCSKIVDVLPKVIDRALSENGEIKIFLTKSLKSTTDILCQIESNGNILNTLHTTLEETILIIMFKLLEDLGDCKVTCRATDNTTDWGERNITLVDSRMLVLTSLKPLQVVAGEEFEMTLQVHKMETLLDLVCYVTYNASVVAMLPTNDIEGNPLMSTVHCPKFQPVHPGIYYVGVAYTYSAIPELRDRNTQRLIVQPTVPKMISALFTQDLRFVCIDFDQNIATSSDCNQIFEPRTVALFGKDPVCTYNTNKLCIQLDKGALIMPGDILELSVTSGVYSALSDSTPTQVTGSIQLSKGQISRPLYKLIGPSFICPLGEPYYYRPSKKNQLTVVRNNSIPLKPTVITIVTQGLERLQYNWTIGFDVINESQSMSPSQQQRRNVLTWFTAREMIKYFNTESASGDIKVNAKMVIPNIKYSLQVIGRNYLGVEGLKVNKTVQIASHQQNLIEIILYTPISVSPMQEIMVEARIMSVCSNKTILKHNTKFVWEVKHEDLAINLPLQSGPKLTIPAGTLAPEKLYDVTCKLVENSNNSVLAVGKVKLSPQNPKLEAYIYPSELVVGTGYTIELYSTLSSNQLDVNDFQFMWSCQTFDGHSCFMPGPNASQLEYSDVNNFQKSVLKLKAGSLAIGRYLFFVAVKVPDMALSIHSEPSLLIVTSRNPPAISVAPPSTSVLDSNKEYSISAIVNDVGPECYLKWSSLAQTSFEYLPLDSLIGNRTQIVLPLDFTASVKHFPLIFPPNSFIKSGRKYKFRLQAHCRTQSSHADIVLKVPSLPVVQNLQVLPLDGVALETRFQFSTNPAYAEADDFPLTYSFGYILSSSSDYYFYKSQVWLSTESTLPAGGPEISSHVDTLLKVCNVHKTCSIIAGPKIKTRKPNQVSAELIRKLSEQLNTVYDQGDINEGQSLAVSVLTTLKELSDKSAYLNISDLVTSLTLTQISLVMNRLDRDRTSLPAAASLLEAVNLLIPVLPTYDSILSELVPLRDKVLMLIKQNSSRPARAEFLPAEPRHKTRSKRQQQVPNNQPFLSLDMIRNLLKTSEAAMLNFNNKEKSLNEKEKFLHSLDDYISELCKHQINSHNVYLGFKVLSLSVQRLSVSENIKTLLPLPKCSSNCTISPSNLILGRMFGSQYKMADSICLAGIGLTTDILSETHNISITESGSRVSNIYRMQVLVYSSKQNITRFKPPQVSLQIPIESSFSNSSLRLKCKIWLNGWTDKECDTILQSGKVICKCPAYSYYSVFVESVQELQATTTVGQAFTTMQAIMNPSQHQEGINIMTTSHTLTFSSKPFHSTYTPHQNVLKSDPPQVSVQAEIPTRPSMHDSTSVQSDTQFPHLTSNKNFTDSHTIENVKHPAKYFNKGAKLLSRKVAFRIDENFEIATSHGVTNFEKLIKEQILKQTNMPEQMLEDLYVTEGSIMVTLELLDTEEQTVDEAIPQLAEILSRGNMRLVGPEEKVLKVPSQGLQVLDHQYLAKTSSVTPASLTPVLLIATIALISCLVVAALIKKQRRDIESTQRISQRLEMSTIPRYLRPYCEQTLDGSVSTLSKFPSTSNFAPVVGVGYGEELDSGIVLITDKVEQKKQNSFSLGKAKKTTDIFETTRALPEGQTVTCVS